MEVGVSKRRSWEEAVGMYAWGARNGEEAVGVYAWGARNGEEAVGIYAWVPWK